MDCTLEYPDKLWVVLAERWVHTGEGELAACSTPEGSCALPEAIEVSMKMSRLHKSVERVKEKLDLRGVWEFIMCCLNCAEEADKDGTR